MATRSGQISSCRRLYSASPPGFNCIRNAIGGLLLSRLLDWFFEFRGMNLRLDLFERLTFISGSPDCANESAHGQEARKDPRKPRKARCCENGNKKTPKTKTDSYNCK